MQVLANKEQSQELDKQAQSHGLSPESLMDTAGFKSAEWLLKTFPQDYSFCIFCGPGHNGGDGWVTASYLKKAGRSVQVFACESSNTLFQKTKNKAQFLKVKTKKLRDWESRKKEILIDALFGVGLSRPIEGEFKELILKINQADNRVISLDTPSGLCVNTGLVLNSSIRADYTLSFALAKPGFYLNEGPSHSGEVCILPIGFPKDLLDKVCHSLQLVQKKDLRSFLPVYKDTANKRDRGWSLIVAGQKGLWGCGLLACRAAYTVGSGYVTWAGASYPHEESLQVPEALFGLLSDKDLFDKKTALGVGPGLGFSKTVEQFLLKLKKLQFPMLWDADAITFLAKKQITDLDKNILLTPHSGELSRLINIPSQTIDRDRLLYAEQGARKYNTWLLLKGFYPILSNGNKSWIIDTGNSALGKAGTGDVLTGVITGLMAQGLSVFQAGLLGAYLHGETARRWLRQGKHINSFSASRIIEELPFVMSELIS